MEILAALKAAEDAFLVAKALYAEAASLVAAAKAKGDPLSDEVIAQMARVNAAQADVDTIAG